MRSITRADRPAADLWAARVLAALVAVVVCFPVLGRGFTLTYDMVFVPDPALSARSWGGDGSVPRAVPMDAVLALLGRVLAMDLVQQGLLLTAVGAAVLGAWRVSPAATLPGAAAGALAYGWTPYLAERLVMGHWSLLLGVALLPWILRAGLRRLRESEPGAPWSLVALAAAGALAAPTSGVLTAVLVLGLAVVLPLAGRHRLLLLGSVLLVNATWVVPGLLASARLSADERGVSAFAASPDTPGGALVGGVVSLVTGGGAWNQLAHPVSRGLPVAVAVSLAVVLVALVGWRGAGGWWAGHGSVARTRAGRRAAGLVLGLGVLGLALALASLWGPGRDALVWATGHVPGAGILRDSHKWVAWWLLPVSLGVGPGLERLTGAVGGPQGAFLVLCGALLPVVALPDLAAGVDGRLARVSWPEDYLDAAEVLNDSRGAGGALVLPWHAFRAWSWNEDRTVLDPWNRLLERPVVVRDDLEVASGVVAGEDPTAAWVTSKLEDGGLSASELQAHDIRYVVSDLETAGRDVPDVAAGLGGTVVFESPSVRVIDLGRLPEQPPRAGHRWVLLLDLAAAAWALTATVLAGVRRRVGTASRNARRSTG